jgi:hypothetical protein
MSRISSIFEGFIPPPTPGASLSQHGQRQKSEATAEEKPSDDLQPAKPLASTADKAAEGVEHASGHHGSSGHAGMSSMSSIEKKPDPTSDNSFGKSESQGSIKLAFMRRQGYKHSHHPGDTDSGDIEYEKKLNEDSSSETGEADMPSEK